MPTLGTAYNGSVTPAADPYPPDADQHTFQLFQGRDRIRFFASAAGHSYLEVETGGAFGAPVQFTTDNIFADSCAILRKKGIPTSPADDFIWIFYTQGNQLRFIRLTYNGNGAVTTTTIPYVIPTFPGRPSGYTSYAAMAGAWDSTLGRWHIALGYQPGGGVLPAIAVLGIDTSAANSTTAPTIAVTTDTLYYLFGTLRGLRAHMLGTNFGIGFSQDGSPASLNFLLATPHSSSAYTGANETAYTAAGTTGPLFSMLVDASGFPHFAYYDAAASATQKYGHFIRTGFGSYSGPTYLYTAGDPTGGHTISRPPVMTTDNYTVDTFVVFQVKANYANGELFYSRRQDGGGAWTAAALLVGGDNAGYDYCSACRWVDARGNQPGLPGLVFISYLSGSSLYSYGFQPGLTPNTPTFTGLTPFIDQDTGIVFYWDYSNPLSSDVQGWFEIVIKHGGTVVYDSGLIYSGVESYNTGTGYTLTWGTTYTVTVTVYDIDQAGFATSNPFSFTPYQDPTPSIYAISTDPDGPVSPSGTATAPVLHTIVTYTQGQAEAMIRYRALLIDTDHASTKADTGWITLAEPSGSNFTFDFNVSTEGLIGSLESGGPYWVRILVTDGHFLQGQSADFAISFTFATPPAPTNFTVTPDSDDGYVILAATLPGGIPCSGVELYDLGGYSTSWEDCGLIAGAVNFAIFDPGIVPSIFYDIGGGAYIAGTFGNAGADTTYYFAYDYAITGVGRTARSGVNSRVLPAAAVAAQGQCAASISFPLDDPRITEVGVGGGAGATPTLCAHIALNYTAGVWSVTGITYEGGASAVSTSIVGNTLTVTFGHPETTSFALLTTSTLAGSLSAKFCARLIQAQSFRIAAVSTYGIVGPTAEVDGVILGARYAEFGYWLTDPSNPSKAVAVGLFEDPSTSTLQTHNDEAPISFVPHLGTKLIKGYRSTNYWSMQQVPFYLLAVYGPTNAESGYSDYGQLRDWASQHSPLLLRNPLWERRIVVLEQVSVYAKDGINLVFTMNITDIDAGEDVTPFIFPP